MPYSVEWYTPKRILYQRFYGVLTLEEVRALSDETFALVQEGENPTHMILDMRALTDHPKRIIDMHAAYNNTVSPNFGWIVFVSENRLLVFFASTLTQIVIPHLRMRWVKTLEEAVAFLTTKLNIPPNEPV